MLFRSFFRSLFFLLLTSIAVTATTYGAEKNHNNIPEVDFTTHQIAINQIGYVTKWPKRFTAPLSPDGTPFVVRSKDQKEILFKGSILKNIGDFSSFQPSDSSQHYIIELSGGTLKRNTSEPFLIRSHLIQEQQWQAAVDFFIDSRSVMGSHASGYGGCPWRDGTYYDAIIPSLAMLYVADPKTIDAMPRQIDWQADKKRVLAPSFTYNMKDPSGPNALKAAKAYFELEPPKAEAPDVVKMIHWGAGFYLVNPKTKDPSGDPDKERIHAQTVEQVAYVLWAWPSLQQWLPASFYEKCREFCFANWQPSLGISSWWDPKTYLAPEQLKEGNPMGGLLHPYKGRHAPGHSIVPNLIMHEVALREKRPDAAKYLDAAVKQADWCVKNLDWNDPRTTKGHRMSEHRTIPNLVWLLQKYPKHAPAGLKEKINAWVDVAISRSENLWDFRRYDLQEHWTIPKINDVGNSLGLPACLIAASWVADPAKKSRIEEMYVASIDHVFGRNPRLAAAPCKPQMGFPEIERGWPWHHKDGICARLETCRGSISTLPGSEMFPFKPMPTGRHAEGWVNYGAAWCVTLSYLQYDLKKSTP